MGLGGDRPAAMRLGGLGCFRFVDWAITEAPLRFTDEKHATTFARIAQENQHQNAHERAAKPMKAIEGTDYQTCWLNIGGSALVRFSE